MWAQLAMAAYSMYANRKASKAGAAGGQAQADYNERMYNQTRSDLAPWRQGGELGLNELQYRMGLSPGGAGGSGPGERPTPQQFQQQAPMSRQTYIQQNTAGESHYSRGSAEIRAGREWDAMYGNMGQDPGAYNEAVANWEKQNAAWQQQQKAAGGDPKYGSLLEPFDLDKFEASPGYNYRLERGRDAVNKGAASRGNYYATETLENLGRNQQGIASDEYGAAYGRYNNDQSNVYNRLLGISDMGQNAANQTGTAGARSAVGYGEGVTGAGNARMAGGVALANIGIDAYNAYKQGSVLSQNQAPTYSGGQGPFTPNYGSA